MKKFLLPVVLLLVGLGLGYSIPHGAKPSNGPVGGLYSPNTSQFVNGLTAGTTNQFAVDSSGNATTTGNLTAATLRLPASSYATSSSSPAALTAAVRGQF